MQVGVRQASALVTLLAVLAVSNAASAADGPWQSFVDKTYGIEVAIPKSWYVLPPTVAGVRSRIQQLSKQQAGLAEAYSTFISTATARSKMLSYHFQAFQYIPGATTEPDFTLGFARTPHAYTVKDLTAITKSIGAAFASRGMTVATAKVVTLPAGPAAFSEGNLRPAGVGPGPHIEVYVIAHGKLLYQLSFSASAGTPDTSATFSGIARRFAFD